MRITNVEQLVQHFRECHTTKVENFTLYVASREHKLIDIINSPQPPIIGKTLWSKTDFINWFDPKQNKIRSASLLDMNIPENHYNDWWAFTTLEEAGAYLKPPETVEEKTPEPKAMRIYVVHLDNGEDRRTVRTTDEKRALAWGALATKYKLGGTITFETVNSYDDDAFERWCKSMNTRAKWE